MVNFDEMYSGAYYTIIGAGGDIEEWYEGYQNLLDERDIGKIASWVKFTGQEMNEFYGIDGYTRYPNDVVFLAFPLTNLDIGKLAIFKLMMNDHWFNDIVDNIRR